MISAVVKFALFMGVYTCFLFFANEAMRKHSKLTFYGFLIAVVTSPLWLLNLGSWFRWGKTIIVIVPLIVFVGIGKLANLNDRKGKFWDFYRGPAVHKVLWVVLVLNILMAVVKDVEEANWFNAVAGLLIAVTAPLPTKGRWKFENNDFSKTDYIAKASWQWCLLYTVWNVAFVYGEHPSYLASSICLLAAPMIYCCLKRSDLWMHARIITLGIHLVIRACFDIFSPVIDSSSWENPKALSIFGMVNAALAVGYLIAWIVKGAKSRSLEKVNA